MRPVDKHRILSDAQHYTAKHRAGVIYLRSARVVEQRLENRKWVTSSMKRKT